MSHERSNELAKCEKQVRLDAYLEEADVIGVLLEASTAHHQTILSNQTVVVGANTAKRREESESS